MRSLTERQLSSPITGTVCRDFRRAFRFSSPGKKNHNEEHAAAGLWSFEKAIVDLLTPAKQMPLPVPTPKYERFAGDEEHSKDDFVVFG
jgi:hypothetical protein